MLNRIHLIGRVGKDPDVKFTASGDAVTNLSLATGDVWKDKDGQRQQKTEWHKLVAFRKQAENMGQYCTKGKLIYVEGKLVYRNWEDKDGVKHTTAEIQVTDFKLLEGKSNGGAKQDDRSDLPPMGSSYDSEVPF